MRNVNISDHQHLYCMSIQYLYPILVKFVHVTTLHLGVTFMGRHQREAPLTFHMSKTNVSLCSFLASCFRRSKIPKTWRRATVVALPKPNNPAQDPNSYRPISLLRVPFKILERLIHSRIDPLVDPQLPREGHHFSRAKVAI